MTDITITWNAGFGYPLTELQIKELAEAKILTTTSLTTILDTDGMDDEAIAERLFAQTNMYNGPWWEAIEPYLPPRRHHTALSVGDTVTIDGRVWLVKPMGWKQVA